MKRLTENYEEYMSRFPKELRGDRKRYPMESDTIYERLGAYEDLEERLQKIYGEHDGLLEKIVEELEQHEGIDFLSPAFKSILLTNGEVERWEELKRLEEQKKLLKLPCAVGDIVYQHMIVGIDAIKKRPIYEIFEAVVFKFSFDSYRLCFWTETTDEKKCQNKVPLSAFGKTVFRTMKEAETALKELENRN